MVKFQFEGIAPMFLLLYMACISAVAYTLWSLLLKYNPPSRIAVFGFMNPVFGVMLSALLLKRKRPGVLLNRPDLINSCMYRNLYC